MGTVKSDDRYDSGGEGLDDVEINTGEKDAPTNASVIGQWHEPARFVKLSQTVSPWERRMIRKAMIVSTVSIFASFIFGVGSMVRGFGDDALAMVGLGVEVLLEAQSSAFVLWRFKKPKERHYSGREAAMKFKIDRDAQRERDATSGVSVLFMSSAMVITFCAMYKICTFDASADTAGVRIAAAQFAEVYSWPVGITFIVLAWIKWTLGYDLNSEVLRLDALASFMGAFMALIVGTAALMEDHDGAWMADPVAALFIASVLLFTGYRTWTDAHSNPHLRLYEDPASL